MGIGQRGPTGSLANERGRAKTASGAPACFLSGISGWLSLSLGAWGPKKLARRNMEVWLRRRRRRFGFSDFRFEAAAATLSGTGSASPRPDRNSWLREARVNLFCTSHAREALNGHRSARSYGVARYGRGRAKTAWG